MPYRNWNLVVAIIGAAAVAILLVVGANVLLASRTGPAWRRKLIAAGLTLLAAIGVATPGCTPPAAPASQPTSASASQPTGATSQPTDSWAAVCENWRFMESLKKESTQAQREQADAAYEKIKTAIEKMGSEGELSSVEKSLLERELEFLREKIYATKPSDPGVECYKMMRVDYVGKSFEHVNIRLKTLTCAGGVEKLNSAVVEKILQTMIDDVAMLESSESSQKSISEDDRKKTASAARETIKTMKARLSSPTSSSASKPVNVLGK